METIQDFEDMLDLLERSEVRYLIVGGLAFIYHVKPRYTKDIDLWSARESQSWQCHQVAEHWALRPVSPDRSV